MDGGVVCELELNGKGLLVYWLPLLELVAIGRQLFAFMARDVDVDGSWKAAPQQTHEGGAQLQPVASQLWVGDSDIVDSAVGTQHGDAVGKVVAIEAVQDVVVGLQALGLHQATADAQRVPVQ